MLTHVHMLLTYQCTFECDHCFLHCGPFSRGTMTLAAVRRVLEQSLKTGSVNWIYFEGGEPFLYYPLLVEGVALARRAGFLVGIVTNAYWATSEDDAELWLHPLLERGLNDLSISDDRFHHGDEQPNPAKRALAAAYKLGIETSAICIQQPSIEEQPGQGQSRGAPVVGGGAMFKGRAVDKLTGGLPRRPWKEFTRCPHEDLQSPSRVHVDPYGHVHACQGISLGNIFQMPLSELVKEETVAAHPICAPLAAGGPAALAETYRVEHQPEYIDECHFCYLVRRAMIDRFPAVLAPRQVYGLQESTEIVNGR